LGTPFGEVNLGYTYSCRFNSVKIIGILTAK
jgi:hypothetical protein